MLQNFPMYSDIPARDAARARRFYEDTIGLKAAHETAGGVVYEFANGWQVQGIERVVAELKKRGVKFEQYDLPGMKEKDGIYSGGGARAAWFKDSEGNILAVIEED